MREHYGVINVRSLEASKPHKLVFRKADIIATYYLRKLSVLLFTFCGFALSSAAAIFEAINMSYEVQLSSIPCPTFYG